MATAPLRIDYPAQIISFLLRAYVADLNDQRLPPEERLLRRMALEDFVLSSGIGGFRVLQRGLLEEGIERNPQVAEWFTTFAFSLAGEWAREVSLSVVEGFWRAIPERRLRTKAVHLITKVEVDNDPSLASAHGSGLVRLFREAQPIPLEEPLADDARLIIQALFGRVKVTPLALWDTPSGALSRYALRVVRYCYKDMYERLLPNDLDRIVQGAGTINDDMRDRIRLAMLL